MREIYRQTWRLFKPNIPLVSAIVLTIWLPAGLLIWVLEAGPWRGAGDQIWNLAHLPGAISTVALLFVLWQHRQGVPTSYRQGMREGCRKWARLLVARFCVQVLFLLGLLLVIVPGLVALMLRLFLPDVMTVWVFFALLIVLSVVILIRFALVAAVIVVENAGVTEALRRSFALTRGRSWRIFEAVFLWSIPCFIVFLPPLIVLSLMNEALATALLPIGMAMSLALLQALLLALYLEARRENEGLDTPAASGGGALRPRGRAYLALLPLVLLVTALPSLRSSVYDWNDVPTEAMVPTIVAGDRIFVNKMAYDLKIPFTSHRLAELASPVRGDVVVFHSPENGELLVKRIIGLPGDILEIRNSQLMINGVAPTYSDLQPAAIGFHPTAPNSQRVFKWENAAQTGYPIMRTSETPRYWYPPVEIPAAHCFVLGDNRDNSRDSRFFGPVARSAISGKVTTIALSLDVDDFYRPRWYRFLSRLPQGPPP